MWPERRTWLNCLNGVLNPKALGAEPSCALTPCSASGVYGVLWSTPNSLKRAVQIASGLLWFVLLMACGAAPANSAFTYQGHLRESGAPANGSFDLQFALFPSETGGNPHSAVLTNSDVAVSNGIFTVTLDFGANVFSGASCWLEIGVRRAG